MSRPFERWSSVTAAIAVAVGVRAAICTTPGADLDRLGVRGDPRAEGERVVAPRLRHPHRVVAEALGILGELDESLARRGPPVPEHDSELHRTRFPSRLAIVGRGPYLPDSWTSR